MVLLLMLWMSFEKKLTGLRCCSVEICYRGAQGVEIQVYNVEGLRLHHFHKKRPIPYKHTNTQSGICGSYAELDVACRQHSVAGATAYHTCHQ